MCRNSWKVKLFTFVDPDTRLHIQPPFDYMSQRALTFQTHHSCRGWSHGTPSFEFAFSFLDVLLESQWSLSPAARGGNLAKIPPNQVIDDFGRGSSVESESE